MLGDCCSWEGCGSPRIRFPGGGSPPFGAPTLPPAGARRRLPAPAAAPLPPPAQAPSRGSLVAELVSSRARE